MVWSRENSQSRASPSCGKERWNVQPALSLLGVLLKGLIFVLSNSWTLTRRAATHLDAWGPAENKGKPCGLLQHQGGYSNTGRHQGKHGYLGWYSTTGCSTPDRHKRELQSRNKHTQAQGRHVDRKNYIQEYYIQQNFPSKMKERWRLPKMNKNWVYYLWRSQICITSLLIP